MPLPIFFFVFVHDNCCTTCSYVCNTIFAGSVWEGAMNLITPWIACWHYSFWSWSRQLANLLQAFAWLKGADSNLTKSVVQAIGSSIKRVRAACYDTSYRSRSSQRLFTVRDVYGYRECHTLHSAIVKFFWFVDRRYTDSSTQVGWSV